MKILKNPNRENWVTTHTMVATVLGNYVTITSHFRSGQSDVLRTFWDTLSRSPIGQHCEEQQGG